MAAVAPVVNVNPQLSTITNAQVLPVTIAVTGSGAVPTGTVVLTAGSFISGATTLANGACTVIVPAGALAIGPTQALSAAYTPDAGSSGSYLTANGTKNVAVVKVSVQLPSKLAGYTAQLSALIGGVQTLIAGMKELSGGFKVDQLDSTDHGNNGWKSRMPGLNDFEGSATLDYITGDASQAALVAAVLNHTVLNVILLPVASPGSGAESWAGPVTITDWQWDGKNTDLQGVKLTFAGAGPFAVVTQ